MKNEQEYELRKAVVDWIGDCLEAAGVASVSALARKAEIAHTTLTRFLAGKTKHIPSTRTLAAVADAAKMPLPMSLQVELGWRAKLIGYVGAGDEIVHVESDFEHADEVSAPPGLLNGACLKVRGESMYPVYRDGDLLFFSWKEGAPLRDALRNDCVLWLATGEAMCKRLERGTRPNRYRLASYNQKDIEDAHVIRAFPVAWIRRA